VLNATLQKYERHLTFVPTLVLLTVAALHAYNAKFHHLSPWKGGGFGMFSTSDLPAARFVRVFLDKDTDHGVSPLPVQLPNDLEWINRLASRARTMPTPSNTLRLAGALAELDWRIYVPEGPDTPQKWLKARVAPAGSRGTLSTPGERASFQRVRVEIHRLRLNVEDWSLSSQKLAEARMTP
jgi:hypothetical protein